MTVSKGLTELSASIEEQYLQDFKAEEPSDIYFELGAILASRMVRLQLDESLDPALAKLAEKHARMAVRYHIGYEAYAADASQGSTEALEGLLRQVAGEDRS